MFRSTVVTIALMIAVFTCSCPSNAQTIPANNDIIILPHSQIKDVITLQFFYSKNGDYSDFTSTFLGMICYKNYSQLAADFPFSKDSALIKFDWVRLAQFGEHQNWNSIVQTMNGITYVGGRLDMKLNYDAEKIRIIDIQRSSFIPACAPDTEPYFIKVYLTDK